MENLLSKMKYYYGNSYYALLEKAYNFANTAHKGQKRASGDDFISHPYYVADILVDMGLDVYAVAAAMLHDVVEDTIVTNEQLKKEFGEEICMLVDGVTKLEKIKFNSKEEEQAENLRKMFVAMAKDIRVILIKLADRLHNMRSLNYLSKDRQLSMARETLDIYAPIAGRLGISNIKCELEDLSLKYLEPQAYKDLIEAIAHKKAERQDLVNIVIDNIKSMLKEINVEAEVFGRPKHFYSIYKKMKLQNKTIDQIYDLIAVRIIVDSVKDCYNVLGTIHTKWKPIPGRIKDYIATPKPNMYQSLHTTVVTNFGQIFEIQIRTKEMHKTAEYGIAAHWKYKENKNGKSAGNELSWVKEVLEWQGDFKDSREFYKGLKGDLVSNEVLVFTPKGDVVSLPVGSTTLDFAYHIHSAIGNKCTGAKINSKMVPLSTQMEVGDIVEIITSSSSKGPSLDWLKIVKTSGAKAKIRQFFKKEMKEENIKYGKEMLEREAKRKGYDFYTVFSEKALIPIMEKYSFSSTDEIFAAVGYGGITTNQVLFKLIQQYDNNRALSTPKKEEERPATKKSLNATGVIIKGFDDLLVRFAGCCNPVPGDIIIGFISRGRGISVHRNDCPNLRNADKERLIDAQWSTSKENKYTAGLQILAYDSSGLLATIGSIVSEMKLNITGINARVDKNNKAIINVTVSLNNILELDMLINKLKSNQLVIDVYRTKV
ncbi:MAG: bifunctional (p)ppGpp synthetase/guanosine-3',5'-bis(diphosphate) 3'-pyrophosphohydrolase [Clostridia bacterium]|nr:bifunctional (p)ppGpp synthetase/guanosine-3',5'-bis(diphosphate) 3'-pyrophosphohydrolase [Clostridia bacterium]